MHGKGSDSGEISMSKNREKAAGTISLFPAWFLQIHNPLEPILRKYRIEAERNVKVIGTQLTELYTGYASNKDNFGRVKYFTSKVKQNIPPLHKNKPP